MLVANGLRESGQLEAAEEILVRLAGDNPKSTEILAVLGDVYWDLGRLDDAVQTFRRATGLSPTLELVSLGLFHCLWKLGKRDEAMEEIMRFQTISDSQEYREIVEAINKEG